MFTWIPDGAKIKKRMIYAASKQTLKSELYGVGIMINANDASELDFETCIMPEVVKFA
jgi:cofilin